MSGAIPALSLLRSYYHAQLSMQTNLLLRFTGTISAHPPPALNLFLLCLMTLPVPKINDISFVQFPFLLPLKLKVCLTFLLEVSSLLQVTLLSVYKPCHCSVCVRARVCVSVSVYI
jgi:hypothetical protein